MSGTPDGAPPSAGEDRDASDISGEPLELALLLEHVSRSFGDVVAVADLTLHVEAGEVIGLLGHNGAGKTTTVRMLAGLLECDSGVVRVGGANPVTEGPAVRQRLGVLPASPVVDERLTARRNLRFAADTFGLPIDGLEARIDAALDRFELSNRADERVSGFSTGMRQRLSLARVLLPDPTILLLDEPTSSLDPVAARQVRRAIAGLARDRHRTVVLCTHDLAEAEQLCDRVVVLAQGRSVLEGRPSELAADHGSGGVQLEVRAEAVPQVRDIITGIAAGAELEVAGGGRVRASGVTRDAVPLLVRALGAADIDVYEVRRLDPTLEDVYLALHLPGGTDQEGRA